LEKIDAALFARAALTLFVFARRTFVAQGGMASRAESRHVARFAAAFRALHVFIVSPPGVSCRGSPRACAHMVNSEDTKRASPTASSAVILRPPKAAEESLFDFFRARSRTKRDASVVLRTSSV